MNDNRVILVPDDSAQDYVPDLWPKTTEQKIGQQLGRGRNRLGEIEHCCWPGCGASRYEEPDAPPFCGSHLVRCAAYVSDTMRDLIDPLHEGSSVPAPPPSAAVDQAPHTVVYYVRIGDHIKIGSTTNLKQRLASFYIDHDPAALLATEPGDYGHERARHAQFAAERVYANRELFNPSRRLLAHIAALQGAGGGTG